jgi:hypothetical protein
VVEYSPTHGDGYEEEDCQVSEDEEAWAGRLAVPVQQQPYDFVVVCWNLELPHVDGGVAVAYGQADAVEQCQSSHHMLHDGCCVSGVASIHDGSGGRSAREDQPG